MKLKIVSIVMYSILLCVTLEATSDHSARKSRSITELKPTAKIHVGATADWVAITSDSVWVGSTGPNAVHKILRNTNQLIATVALPGEPCAGLAIGFGSLWVPLCGDRPGLAKVDLASHKLMNVFNVSAVIEEGGITTSADSVWLVVDKTGSLARIDPQSGVVRKIFHVAPGSYNPRYDDGLIWITRAEGSEVTALDATTGTIRATVPSGPKPRFLTAGAGAIWTLNQGDGTLTRIDTRSKKVTTIALGTPGHGGDISFGGGMIWTTVRNVPLSAIDATTDTLLCQWTGPGGDSLSVTDDAIWITDYHGGTISRIELKDALADCKDSSGS